MARHPYNEHTVQNVDERARNRAAAREAAVARAAGAGANINN